MLLSSNPEKKSLYNRSSGSRRGVGFEAVFA